MKRNSFLGIQELSADEISYLLDFAEEFKRNKFSDKNLNPTLKGKRIVNLFLEPSTRTRIAFEVAAKSLDADIISIAEKSSSLTKGESLRDTASNIQALGADAIVLRHSSPGSAKYLSDIIDVPVINAGDGAHEHPSQALLDLFTLRDKLGDLQEKKITILGDILFSRVARSNIWGLKKLGAKITLAGPSTLVPKKLEKLGVSVSYNLNNAIEKADAIMLLRIQHERQTQTHFPSLEEYSKMFGLRGSDCKPPNKTIILHPGPINRGVEIDSMLADSRQSVILDQVKNGVNVRKAILYTYCS
ncbi:MAG: aspartate carbamoyltransferase catalytic subunit [Verrucomicrobiota bacterium]|nr:aspartate carbamoyltransferase catalytic subunit [Verrucomicrobiota bacterium]|tara:strand:- start:303 stop:1208 length:906 start_codon:yes stop_codon:yes gene_type:complete